jgi:GTPase SAR1 family protein
MFTTVPDKNLDWKKVKMTCDRKLANDIPAPLPSVSAFLMLVVGSSGSGKTNFVINLISKKHKKVKGVNKRQSLYQVFDKLIICSPSLKTLEEDVFKSLDDSQKYDNFDDCMNEIYEHLAASEAKSNNKDKQYDPQTTLLVIDDCATQLRANRRRELQLVSLLQNRRHVGGGGLSCILISQKYNMIPTGIRCNLSHLVLYKMKTIQESDTIKNEILPLDTKTAYALFKFVFDAKYRFLYVDMTLERSNKLWFYKDFDLIENVLL